MSSKRLYFNTLHAGCNLPYFTKITVGYLRNYSTNNGLCVLKLDAFVMAEYGNINLNMLTCHLHSGGEGSSIRYSITGLIFGVLFCIENKFNCEK